jgi:hypothetical protein
MGTWYGIRVSRTPADRVLNKWLVHAEEAVDRFTTEVCGFLNLDITFSCSPKFSLFSAPRLPRLSPVPRKTRA